MIGKKTIDTNILGGTVDKQEPSLGQMNPSLGQTGPFVLNSTVKLSFCPVCPWDGWGFVPGTIVLQGPSEKVDVFLCLLFFCLVNEHEALFLPITSFDGPLLGFEKSRSRGKDEKIRHKRQRWEKRQNIETWQKPERQTSPKNGLPKVQHKNPAPHKDSIQNADQVVLQTQAICPCESVKRISKNDFSSTRSSARLFPPTKTLIARSDVFCRGVLVNFSTDWHSQVYQLLSLIEWNLLGRWVSNRKARNLRSLSGGDRTPTLIFLAFLLRKGKENHQKARICHSCRNPWERSKKAMHFLKSKEARKSKQARKRRLGEKTGLSARVLAIEVSVIDCNCWSLAICHRNP